MSTLKFIVFFVELHFVPTFGVYTTSNSKDVSLIENSQRVQARSPTECVLRCRRLDKEAFYTEGEKCLCTDGIMKSNNNQNDVKVSGSLYSKKTILPANLCHLWICFNVFIISKISKKKKK